MRELVDAHLVSKFAEMPSFLILVAQVYRPRYCLHIRFLLYLPRRTDILKRSLMVLELLDENLLHIFCGIRSILLDGDPIVKVSRVPFSIRISLLAA